MEATMVRNDNGGAVDRFIAGQTTARLEKVGSPSLPEPATAHHAISFLPTPVSHLFHHGPAEWVEPGSVHSYVQYAQAAHHLEAALGHQVQCASGSSAARWPSGRWQAWWSFPIPSKCSPTPSIWASPTVSASVDHQFIPPFQTAIAQREYLWQLALSVDGQSQEPAWSAQVRRQSSATTPHADRVHSYPSAGHRPTSSSFEHDTYRAC